MTDQDVNPEEVIEYDGETVEAAQEGNPGPDEAVAMIVFDGPATVLMVVGQTKISMSPDIARKVALELRASANRVDQALLEKAVEALRPTRPAAQRKRH
jgi:hypothetical protein